MPFGSFNTVSHGARSSLTSGETEKKEPMEPYSAPVAMEELIRTVEEHAQGEALANMPRGRLQLLYTAAVKAGRAAGGDDSISTWNIDDIPDIETMLVELADAEDRFRLKPKPKPPEQGRVYEPGTLRGGSDRWPSVSEFHQQFKGDAPESTGTLSSISATTGDGTIHCNEIQGREVSVASELLQDSDSPAAGDKVTFSWRRNEKGQPEATSVKKTDAGDAWYRIPLRIPAISDEVSRSAPQRIQSRIPGASDMVSERIPSRIPAGTSDEVSRSAPWRIPGAHDEVSGTRAKASSKHSEEHSQAADRGGYPQQKQLPPPKTPDDDRTPAFDLETLKRIAQRRREKADWK